MAPLRGLWETFEVRMGTDGGENGLFHGYRAMKPVNRMMNVRDVNLTGDSGRLQRTADAANTDPYITFIAAQALVIPCTVRSLRIGRVGVSWVIASDDESERMDVLNADTAFEKPAINLRIHYHKLARRSPHVEFTTQCHETLEKSIPLAAQSQCRCNSFAWELHPTETAALRSLRPELCSTIIPIYPRAPLPESMISSAEYLTEDEWDDLDAVSPPSRRERGREKTEQEIPEEKLQAVLNQFTRKALRVVQERNVAARCRRWRSIRPVWLEGRDMGRGLVQPRGRGDHDTTSLRILADILGYSSSADGHESYEKDLIKAIVITETVRRMYTRKKLDEMMVVCESFLEHLRVQSQVLVSALELTWPPAGWALCRPSQPPPLPSTTFRSPYLPASLMPAPNVCPVSGHYYWPSKFRPRGDQAQEHVSTTDPRIKGPRFKGRSLKRDCWSSVTVSSANNQGKSSYNRSLYLYQSRYKFAGAISLKFALGRSANAGRIYEVVGFGFSAISLTGLGEWLEGGRWYQGGRKEPTASVLRQRARFAGVVALPPPPSTRF
ncbi:hypothetical protein ALC62_15122 [Cyphomyrmex costatus]|uniref:Uncharacterized protein n=1 Tax=Cyphomyrmex costatus TaxID=456900 RepID=A0A151I7Z6_9HYME|nr:hypothetical protein ALC62_15122 [Cyphomyrmex costatus]